MSNKVLVTGGNKGVGFEIARQLGALEVAVKAVNRKAEEL
jgi:NAD(P)-dependent dehydrogenase (short-subunit alcohol dehydrogenase family)